MNNRRKGIYCIEGMWEMNNVQDRTTVLPILDLLEKRGICKYVYHDCATEAELEFFINRWKTKTISEKYPILYLAFHGTEGCIYLNKKDIYSLEQLSALLEGKCSGKIIYFGSCSTLNINAHKIKSFLQKTNAIAAIGYTSDVDWIQSAACDLFVFDALQFDKLDSKGIANISYNIKKDYGNLYKRLDLRVVINDRMHFPRSRS